MTAEIVNLRRQCLTFQCNGSATVHIVNTSDKAERNPVQTGLPYVNDKKANHESDNTCL